MRAGVVEVDSLSLSFYKGWGFFIASGLAKDRVLLLLRLASLTTSSSRSSLAVEQFGKASGTLVCL